MAAWVSILSVLVKFQSRPRALQTVAVTAPRDSRHPSIEIERKLASAIDLLLGTDLLIFKPICWKRAAILHRYLALHGIATRIVFGMRKEADGAVDGHAWLEVAGKPIMETTAPNYKVTYAFPSQDVCSHTTGQLDGRFKPSHRRVLVNADGLRATRAMNRIFSQIAAQKSGSVEDKNAANELPRTESNRR